MPPNTLDPEIAKELIDQGQLDPGLVPLPFDPLTAQAPGAPIPAPSGDFEAAPEIPVEALQEFGVTPDENTISLGAGADPILDAGAEGDPNLSLVSDEIPAQQGVPDLGNLGQSMTPGIQMQQIGLAERAQAAEVRGAEEAAVYEGLMDEYDRIQARNDLARQNRDDQIAKLQGDFDTATTELAGMKVEPGKFWGHASTGSQIGAAIGVAMAAVGQGLMGRGPNLALQTIDRAIQRDMQAQKQKIALARDKVSGKRTVLADTMRRFGNVEQAEAAALGSAYKKAQMEVMAVGARAKSGEARANAQILAGQLQEKIDKTNTKLVNDYLVKTSLRSGRDIDPERLDEKQRERFVPGYGLALDKKAAREARTASSGFNNAKGKIDRLIEIAQMGGKSLSPTLIAEADSLATQLRGNLRTDLIGPGAITETEWKLLENIIPNPTDIMRMDAKTITALDTLNNGLNTQFNSRLKSWGLKTRGDRERSLGIRRK